jgi:hypothetical protein
MATFTVSLAVKRYIIPEIDALENPDPRQVTIADLAAWFNAYFKARQSNLTVANIAIVHVDDDYVYGTADLSVPFDPEFAVAAKWLQESYNFIPSPDFWFVPFDMTFP